MRMKLPFVRLVDRLDTLRSVSTGKHTLCPLPREFVVKKQESVSAKSFCSFKIHAYVVFLCLTLTFTYFFTFQSSSVGESECVNNSSFNDRIFSFVR